MNRIWKLMIVLMFPVIAWRRPARWGRPPLSAGGACALRGQSVRRIWGLFGRRDGGRIGLERHGQRNQRKGNYNLSTSAAAINMTEARKNHIQNQNLAANTYFQMRT